jgi:hypothetical protein
MDINDIISYRNKGLNIAIIILAMAIAFNMYRKQIVVVESLKHAKEMEIKKGTTLEGINELEKRVKLYKDFTNKKDPLSLIKTFNKLARLIEVNVGSIKPDKLQEFPMYQKYPYVIGLTAKNFNQLGKFISGLESSPEIFVINSAVIKPIGPVGEGSPNDCLSLDLVVSTIFFK